MHIQISNLNLNLIEADLQRLFTPFGEIETITMERDKFTNRTKGRAVIDMPIEKEALKAIEGLHGSLFSGKIISVASLPYLPGRSSWQ
ncbi:MULTISPECIES: RNA recognition motif domain-containing protein [Chitinophagaceae]|uniref:RNA recognition motif domain-containing protein n=1 Tax=Chitinophagaceae TaxID=563835 RepID=UPI000DEEB5EC|nr:MULTISPECIES: RNA-binding protein [Chitinophagaceae]RPD48783.1 RNA-binding protein [Paracnuella aquatica]